MPADVTGGKASGLACIVTRSHMPIQTPSARQSHMKYSRAQCLHIHRQMRAHTHFWSVCMCERKRFGIGIHSDQPEIPCFMHFTTQPFLFSWGFHCCSLDPMHPSKVAHHWVECGAGQSRDCDIYSPGGRWEKESGSERGFEWNRWNWRGWEGIADDRERYCACVRKREEALLSVVTGSPLYQLGNGSDWWALATSSLPHCCANNSLHTVIAKSYIRVLNLPGRLILWDV